MTDDLRPVQFDRKVRSKEIAQEALERAENTINGHTGHGLNDLALEHAIDAARLARMVIEAEKALELIAGESAISDPLVASEALAALARLTSEEEQ